MSWVERSETRVARLPIEAWGCRVTMGGPQASKSLCSRKPFFLIRPVRPSPGPSPAPSNAKAIRAEVLAFQRPIDQGASVRLQILKGTVPAFLKLPEVKDRAGAIGKLDPDGTGGMPTPAVVFQQQPEGLSAAGGDSLSKSRPRLSVY